MGWIINKLKGLVGGGSIDGNGIKIVAPLTGDVIPLDDVPDVVFSEKLAGDGVAIKPSSNCILAPIAGVVKFFDSSHCFTIKSDTGLELMVHFGIDTVELSGAGFKRMVENGLTVKAGDQLVELDLPYLETNAKSTITPVVVTNAKDSKVTMIHHFEGKATAGFTTIMSVVMEQADAS